MNQTFAAATARPPRPAPRASEPASGAGDCEAAGGALGAPGSTAVLGAAGSAAAGSGEPGEASTDFGAITMGLSHFAAVRVNPRGGDGAEQAGERWPARRRAPGAPWTATARRGPSVVAASANEGGTLTEKAAQVGCRALP